MTKDEHHTVEGLPWDDPFVPKLEKAINGIHWAIITGGLILLAGVFFLLSLIFQVRTG